MFSPCSVLRREVWVRRTNRSASRLRRVACHKPGSHLRFQVYQPGIDECRTGGRSDDQV